MNLRDKKIVLGISGGIAAYKSVYLLRLLQDHGAQVRCLLTESAKQFIGTMTLKALTGFDVPGSVWELSAMGSVGHVALAHWADVIIIAPATAETIAKIANGRANDAISLVTLDSKAPVLIAPAMEADMFDNQHTKRNMDHLLKSTRYHAVGPGTGFLASGHSGKGRMSEPEDIVYALEKVFMEQDLAGKRIVITAGSSREFLDPVRFISNPSTGKMGMALAHVAAWRGAYVDLVYGNAPEQVKQKAGISYYPVCNTQEMLEDVLSNVAEADLLIMAAAPADYIPTQVYDHKIKKREVPQLVLTLTTAPDIIMTIKEAFPHLPIVGFAAESQLLDTYAQEKLQHKQIEMIVANPVTEKNAGFASDTNTATIYCKQGKPRNLPLQTKMELADKIFSIMLEEKIITS